MSTKQSIMRKFFNALRNFVFREPQHKDTHQVKVRDSVTSVLFKAFIAIEIITLVTIILYAYHQGF